MKKLKFLLLSFVLIPCIFLFAACDNGEPYDLTIEEVYSIVQERGYDGSFDEFIESIKGEDGKGIESVEKISSTDETDVYAIVFSDSSVVNFTITNGKDGNGISAISKTNSSYAQDGRLVNEYTILYTNGETYTFVVSDGLNGENGVGIASIIKTNSEGNIDTYTITLTNGNETSFTITNGIDGEDGVGIKTIAKTSTDGLTDIYTITYTDETFTTFTVTNGKDGQDGKNGNGIKSISKTSTDGLTDTYTITLTDGSTTTFTITNGKDGESGEDGVGIKLIAKTATNGLIDTYTITYTDNSTSNFSITNGQNGVSIVSVYKTKTEGNVDTYTITFSDGSESYFTITNGQNGTDGEDGRGILTIAKTSSEGLVDIYTITYSDGTYSTFTVTNGEDGIDGVNGEDGLSAYEIYISYFPEYNKSEKEWIIDLINGNLQTVEPKTYTVTFDSNGGSDVPSQSGIIYAGKATKPEDPIKDGYVFDGWWIEGEKWSFVGYSVTEDITLIAKWIKISNIITFDVNGGTLDNLSMTVYYNEYYSLPTPQKLGYEFKGWYSNNIKYNDGIWLNKQDIQLIAKWEIVNYTITYHLDSGYQSEDNIISYTVNDSVTFYEPSKKGFKFLGWFNEETFSGNKVENLSAGTTGNIELYAKWEAETYNIPLILNGGECNVDTITVKYGESYELPKPTKTNYTFKSWLKNNSNTIIPNSGVWLYDDITSLTAEYECLYVISNNILTGITDKNLSILEIPESVDGVAIKGIGDGAFRNCDNLKTFTIPNSIETIGDYAFYDCDSIIELTIGENVKSIGNYAFAYLDNIQVLNYNAINVEQFELVGDRYTNVFESFGLSNEDGVTVNIGNKVKFLPKGMFNCVNRTVNITSLNFAENGSPTTISARSFEGIPIKTLYLPNSIETIDDFAFNDCDSIIELTIGENVKSIGYGAFSDCVNLKTVTIPNSIETIGAFAFSNCDSIIELTIGENVKSIGNYAFAYLDNIQVLNYNAIDVEQFELEGHQSTNVFELFGLSNEDGVTVNIGNKVKFLPKGMFNGGDGVANITSLNFAENGSPLTISAYCFVGIPIKTLYLPSYIEIIGHRAFVDCRKLEEIYYDVANLNSTVEIEDENGSGIFSYDSAIFAGVGNTSKSVDVVIGENVQSLPERLFNYSYAFPTYITSIDFSKNNFLYQIPSNMGNSLYKLEYIVLPNNLVNFGENSFENCTALTSIYYLGAESESLNTKFPDKTIYYYIEKAEDVPVDEGNYWHYVDGIITIW